MPTADAVSNGFRSSERRTRTDAGSGLREAYAKPCGTSDVKMPNSLLHPTILIARLSATSAREVINHEGETLATMVVVGALPCWNGPHPCDENTQLRSRGASITDFTSISASVSRIAGNCAHVDVRMRPRMKNGLSSGRNVLKSYSVKRIVSPFGRAAENVVTTREEASTI